MGLRAFGQFNEKQYKIFGNISSLYIDVIATVLKEVLEKSGFNIRRIASDFKEIGLIECSDGIRTQFVTTLEGKSVRVYRFIVEKYDTLYN